jgi:hypothetical protein
LLLAAGVALSGEVGLILGLAMIGLGTLLYAREADADKPQGSLSGTLRGMSRRGLAHALPWDLCGAFVVLWVAFTS